jgi:hypothetical protein
MKEARGTLAIFFSFFWISPNWMHDVLVDPGQCLMQQPLCGNDL